jgi:hypothetical protein
VWNGWKLLFDAAAQQNLTPNHSMPDVAYRPKITALKYAGSKIRRASFLLAVQREHP